MNIDLPPWVSHDGQPIYSLDIDRTGKRVATAGSDAKVKVWSLLPLLSARAEEDERAHPRVLATISEHTAAANTARFSGDGRCLATCSDDKLAYVFQLQPGPAKTIFGSVPSLENWSLVHTLRGHSNNVIDVAWSPDDSMLATCSLDNNVIVWSSATGKQIALLEGHDSYVKGVAWDPIGRYLASQSDDKSIIIWRCADWAKTDQITGPFRQGFVSQTFCLRLAWTPDGQHVVAANSYQPPSHCACVLRRGAWDNPFSIVGHQAAVTVVAFNPQPFRDSEGGSEPAFCFALGSQDTRVTLWMTAGMRPRFVFSKMFTLSVTDLAWSADGHTLIACSTEGRIAVARFAEGELGETIPASETQARLDELYGGKRATAGLPLLNSAPDAGLGRPANGGGPLQEMHNAVASPIAPATKPCAKPEPRRMPAKAPPAKGPPAKDARAKRPAAEAPKAGAKGISARLGGAHVVGFRGSDSDLPNGTPDRADFPIAGSKVSATGREDVVGQKRAASGVNIEHGRADKVARRVQAEPVASASTPLGSQNLMAGVAGQRGLPSIAPAPATISVQLGLNELLGSEAPATLLVTNEAGGARLTCRTRDTVLWQDSLGGRVSKAAGNRNFTAVILQDGTLVLHTSGGRRLLPSIRCSDAPAFLCCGQDWRLMAVLCDGAVRLWDIQKLELIVGTSLPPLRGAVVRTARLAKEGAPMLFLSDGSAHLLHTRLQEWICVAHPSNTALQHANGIHGMDPGELDGVDAEAAAAATPASLAAASGREQFTSNKSRRHLEAKVAAALVLESPAEYSRWLLTYVRHLSGETEERPLREVCQDLLGPIRGGPAASDWQPAVLGIDKRSLLREVLREIWRHRLHQKLFAEFRDSLDAAEGRLDGPASD